MSDPEFKGFVVKWCDFWFNSPRTSTDPYACYHYVAERVRDHTLNSILNELEPLHADAVKSIRGVTSPTFSWHQAVADRLEAFVNLHRPNQVTLALEILATIPCDDEDPKFPTLSELGIIREALLSIRNTNV